MGKRVGIMQPYFFPYLGYFALIKATDQWVVFDTPQFIRHGWIERNRVLKQGGQGWIYIKVPLEKGANKLPIDQVRIREGENWRERILEQLKPYRKKASYYHSILELVKDIIFQDTSSISRLNLICLERVTDYLGIEFHPKVFSQFKDQVDLANEPDEWALNISRYLGYDTYINPKDGETFFDRSKYREAGIDLYFMNFQFTPYEQFGNEFEAGLSIIDVMMFNSPAAIREMLDQYTLE